MSMLLSKTCVYAMRATIETAVRMTASKRKFVPIREIADSLNLSFHFLGKITQILTEAGILMSFRGPNGGVGLARPAAKIRLIDIVAATDGLQVFEQCLLGLPECGEKDPCPMHTSWEKARDRVLRALRTKSVASIVRARLTESRKRAG